MVVDISNINLENLAEYQNIYKKQKRKPRGINVKKEKTFNIKEYQKSKKYKEYQHKYYLEVTKIKRKELQAINKKSKELG